jgi:hypothetical protein
MPRPKNYAFEKAQRDRARTARKAASKEARAAAKAARIAAGEPEPTDGSEDEGADDDQAEDPGRD